MAQDDRAALIAQEHLMIRRLRFLVDLTFATIAQDDSITLEQAWEHVRALKGAAVAMFPGKEKPSTCSTCRASRACSPNASAPTEAPRPRDETARAGLIARPDGSTRPGRVSFRRDLESVEPTSGRSADLILPGLIDLQVNGAGIDVMRCVSRRDPRDLARRARTRRHHRFPADRDHLAARTDRGGRPPRSPGARAKQQWPRGWRRRSSGCIWRDRSSRRRAAEPIRA